MKRTPLKRKTPLEAKVSLKRVALKRSLGMKANGRLRPRSVKNKKRPRNFPYMLWIKTLPCAVCGCFGSEAAHTGPRGLGQKAPDEQCIPLCPDHHRIRKDAMDVAGPRRFEAIHAFNVGNLVEKLNRKYYEDIECRLHEWAEHDQQREREQVTKV